MGRVMDNGGSRAARLFPGSIPARHVHVTGFEASRFLLQYLHPDFVNAGVLSRVRCKTARERECAATSEIFTLQFGHVITPDIPQPAPTDAPRVRSVRLCSLSLV